MFKCLTIIILLTKVCVASYTDLNEQINVRVVNSYYSPIKKEPELKLKSIVLIYGEAPINQKYTTPPNYSVVLKGVNDRLSSSSINSSSSNPSVRKESFTDEKKPFISRLENLFKKQPVVASQEIEMQDMSSDRSSMHVNRDSLAEPLLETNNVLAEPAPEAALPVQQARWWDCLPTCLTNCFN